MKVVLTAQVVDFVRRLPPEPRKRLRRALRELSSERGDIKALEAPLDRYCRLRVGGYRVLFAYGKRQTIECIFAERRSVVYELVLERIRDRLRGGQE
jgi:mRNA-degrading endonuclease RelE of RelBE toxin-antitoxin system